MKRTLSIFYILFIACFASYAGVKTERLQVVDEFCFCSFYAVGLGGLSFEYNLLSCHAAYCA